jgi:hypothetical protein
MDNMDNSDNDNSETSNGSSSAEKTVAVIKANPRTIAPKKKQKKQKNNNDLFKELINKQIEDIPSHWKLGINDMRRICKYIKTSIFDPTECCIWNGYITNMNNSTKGTYVNFYFQNKKVALHRLLYSNFVAPLDSNEYLKFNCEHKGICCNVNHYEKYKYTKTQAELIADVRQGKGTRKGKEVCIVNQCSDEDDKLHIEFD